MMDQIVGGLRVGEANTLPLVMAPLPEGCPETRLATICRAAPGVGNRVAERVFVDAVAGGLTVDVDGQSVALVVRSVRMEEDYWVEFLDPSQDILDGLCEQEQAVYLLYDRPDREPARKIFVEVEDMKPLWRAVRDQIRRERPPRDEDEFVVAAARFLADHPDPRDLHRMLKGLRPGGRQRTEARGTDRPRHPLKRRKPRRMFKVGQRVRGEAPQARMIALPDGKVGVAVTGDFTGFRYDRIGSGKMVGPDPEGEYRYPIRDGGCLIIRPEDDAWVCIHPTRGVVGSSAIRDVALAMAEAYAKALRPT